MSAQVTAVLQWTQEQRDCSFAAEIIFHLPHQASEAAAGAEKFPAANAPRNSSGS